MRTRDGDASLRDPLELMLVKCSSRIGDTATILVVVNASRCQLILLVAPNLRVITSLNRYLDSWRVWVMNASGPLRSQ